MRFFGFFEHELFVTIKDNRLFKIKLHRVDVAVVYHGITQKDAPGSRMGPDGATVTYYLK